MSRRAFVITVPHATCPASDPEDTHPCDTAALKGARALQAFLPKNRTYLRVGNITRDETDLNRRKSRQTKFRKGVRALVRRLNLAYDEVVVLDSHSYPKKMMEWQGRQLYLLDIEKIQPWVRRLALKLATDHKDGDVVQSPVKPTIADILLETRQGGNKGVVIEWCERLNEDQIMEYAQLIAEFMQGKI